MLLQARLHAIQIDPGTYTNEPTGSQKEFTDWFATFSIEEKKAEISELLVANVQVRALYTHLVGGLHGNTVSRTVHTNMHSSTYMYANPEWTTPVRIVTKIHKISTKSLQFIFYHVVHTRKDDFQLFISDANISQVHYS